MLPMLFRSLIASVALLATGCATFLNKGANVIELDSNPSGATVYVNGNQKGITPYTYNYTADDGKEVSIEFRRSGFKPSTVIMRPSMNKDVLFVDAMLLGIPFLADMNNPNLYNMPLKTYRATLYKDQNTELQHYNIPVVGVDIDLGDNPDLGKFQRRPIRLKDGIFKDLNYPESLNSAIITGSRNSWFEARSVRLGSAKGDEAVHRAKLYLRPVIRTFKGELDGKPHLSTGAIDVVIDWNFMNGLKKDSMLFQVTTNTTYNAFGVRTYDLITEALMHATKVLLDDETLHQRIASVYGAGLALSKGDVVQIGKPRPIPYNGRKEMLSALVKGVVTIKTSEGHGSGFLISNDGYLITNEHVVRSDATVQVKFEQGFTLDGQVLKTNKDFDLALVKVSASDLPALTMGNDNELMLGEELFAIGTPMDASLGQSVSRGVLSGRRELDGFHFLQTDVSINPGNSGGPLIDENGTVVGVATMKISGRGLEGLGFGVPINKALEMLNISFGN